MFCAAPFDGCFQTFKIIQERSLISLEFTGRGGQAFQKQPLISRKANGHGSSEHLKAVTHIFRVSSRLFSGQGLTMFPLAIRRNWVSFRQDQREKEHHRDAAGCPAVFMLCAASFH
jgi:hypothetical protein